MNVLKKGIDIETEKLKANEKEVISRFHKILLLNSQQYFSSKDKNHLAFSVSDGHLSYKREKYYKNNSRMELGLNDDA